MLIAGFAGLVLCAWIYLTFAHGYFWVVNRHIEGSDAEPNAAKIVAIIPARDEADVIGSAVTSLLQQTLLTPLRLVVVDDNSGDGTGEAAIVAATLLGAQERLRVIRGRTLPAGWTGKLWALQQGVDAAAALEPDYFLFTDADIFHEPTHVAHLVAAAQREGCDLASHMVMLATETGAERLLIPAFVYFFFQLYPPAFIRSSRPKIAGAAGAAGGCMLIKPQTLAAAGGIGAIRSEVIDDCALAGIIKKSGGRVTLQLTREARSIRSYGSFAGIGRMIARSAFFQLRHSYLLLAGTLLGLLLVYGAPALLLLSGDWRVRVSGLLAWTMMSVTFLPTVLLYRQHWLRSACLPVIAIFYGAATLYSAWMYATGSGSRWKGRIQDERGT